MNDTGPRRRSPWLGSQAEGFRPIKQVGVALSIGLPMVAVGALILLISIGGGGALVWVGAGLVVAGLIASLSGAII